MLEQLLNHIRRHALCKTTDKILVAVSGGVDSMVLLHLLLEAGFKIGVAHCNFQLRGDESAADEDLVRETAAQLNVPFFVQRFDTTAYAAARKISIQMAARELRYDFFKGLLEKHPFEVVATAHHFNDTIETTLLNLIRGTGLDGLRGIAPRSGKVIRPLLFATRDAIRDYALQRGITWREDASNLSDDYQRNFLRHQVIPRLQELNPAFEDTFRDTHERIAGASEFSQAFVKEFQSLAVESQDHKIYIDIRRLRQVASPQVMLWEIIKDFGFNFDQCRRMVLDHQPGKLFFSSSHQLLVDRSHFIIERKEPSFFTTMTIEKGQHRVGDDLFSLTVDEVEAKDFQLRKDSTLAQLDADQVQFPLTWRKWQAGDYFVPLGMQQEKKLSDFLIDLKIPFNAKADITVLESAGEIVWVVGYRISERYKVTPGSKRILVIRDARRRE